MSNLVIPKVVPMIDVGSTLTPSGQSQLARQNSVALVRIVCEAVLLAVRIIGACDAALGIVFCCERLESMYIPTYCWRALMLVCSAAVGIIYEFNPEWPISAISLLTIT
jgi:hypothetical protein